MAPILPLASISSQSRFSSTGGAATRRKQLDIIVDLLEEVENKAEALRKADACRRQTSGDPEKPRLQRAFSSSLLRTLSGAKQWLLLLGLDGSQYTEVEQYFHSVLSKLGHTLGQTPQIKTLLLENVPNLGESVLEKLRRTLEAVSQCLCVLAICQTIPKNASSLDWYLALGSGHWALKQFHDQVESLYGQLGLFTL